MDELGNKGKTSAFKKRISRNTGVQLQPQTLPPDTLSDGSIEPDVFIDDDGDDDFAFPTKGKVNQYIMSNKKLLFCVVVKLVKAFKR